MATIAFLFWLHGATKRTAALAQQKLSFSPGWAVGYFFIPFVNLYRVPQILGELWRASEPSYPWDGSWTNNDTSPAIIGWWALQIVSWLLFQASSAQFGERMTREGAELGLQLYGLALLITAVGQFLWLSVVRGIEGRIRERAARLSTKA